MKQVYKASNIQDAHIMRDILRQESIPVEIRGENLAGALGELPAFEISPTLWVPEDKFNEARHIIENVAKQSAIDANLPLWNCGSCGEENEGAFLECWKCSTEKA